MKARPYRSSCTALIAGAALFVSGLSATGDIWFSHDLTVTALAPPPANAVFANPDIQDIFFSTALIRTAPGANLGNALAADNPVALGLQAGDNLGDFHQELRPLGDDYDWFPAFVFTVNAGAIGAAGTNVKLQAPSNAADLYESNGFGFHALDVNENQIGLSIRPRTDVDGFMLTPSTVVNPGGWLYFTLVPGSPTIAALGASPADIFASQVGGVPKVCITAAQLGLDPAVDAVDGLCMLGGLDVNNDGDFNDPGDKFPWVNFSVSPTSHGVVGSAVRSEFTIDPPVGGDIYFSLCLGANNLFFDDGVFQLGLDNKDDVDGLDMPEMAVPANFPGGGGLPPGTPFTGGATTPGAPGTPGGPPLPPPGGGGGGVPSIRIGLCKKAASNGTCKLTIKVSISCNGQNCDQKVDVVVPCDDCDNSNGSEIQMAVQAIAAALSGMKINCPGGGADNGKNVFAGPGVIAQPNPTHVNATLSVNGNLTTCQVNGFNIMLNGCDCYTQNVAAMKWQGGEFIPSDADTIATMSVDADVAQGYYTLQFGEGGQEYALFVPDGPASAAIDMIRLQLMSLGYNVAESSPTSLKIFNDAAGNPITDVWSSGFVDGGTAYGSIGIQLENFVSTPGGRHGNP